MTLEQFNGVLRIASRFLPSEKDKRVQNFYSRFNQMDVPAIVRLVKHIPEVSKYRNYVVASIDGVDEKEIGKALLPFLELYYPQIMTEIFDDEVLFDKFRSVVYALIADLRSGS